MPDTPSKVIDLMAALKASLPARCRAGRDGECSWAECPQNRDGEPAKSGRHCPLDTDAVEEMR